MRKLIGVFLVLTLTISCQEIKRDKDINAKEEKALNDLIQFFNKYAYREDLGTYLSEINNEGHRVSDNVYNVALSRMIYGLSYASYIDDTYLEKAILASEFQIENLISSDSVGYFFLSFYNVNSGEKGSAKELDVWQQAYGLCGLTELYRQQPNENLLSKIHLYHDGFIKRFYDSSTGGFYGNCNLEKGVVKGSKSLQSLMYPITAYMENLWIADTANRYKYEPYIKEVLEIAYENVWDKELEWVNIKFDDEWQPCEHQSNDTPCASVTPGHNFQFSSLLLRTQNWSFLSDDLKSKYYEKGMDILGSTLRKSIFLDNNYSQGFYSQVNPRTNEIEDERKTWWQHSEALIAMSLSGDSYEKEMAELQWFYFQKFQDNKNGGEYFFLDKFNHPQKKENKGSIGKSIYHTTELIRYLKK